MKRDFYETLGVSKSASKEEIKSAYRKMAMQNHPDRNKAADAEEKFKEINEAYEVLSNDQKKAAYDQYGHAAFDPSAGGFGGGRTYTDQSGPFTYTWSGGQNPFGSGTDFDFGGFSNPFDIFEQFFGGGANFGGGRQSRQKQIPTFKIELTFLEAALGAEKIVNVDGRSKTIKIPAGVDNGQRIRFNEFVLFIEILPDSTFKREGNDVYVTQDLNIKQAIFGDDVQVPTLNGLLKVRVKPGTQPNTLVRLRGQGIKDVQGYGQGDLYIRLNVLIPTKLNSHQKDLLKELDL